MGTNRCITLASILVFTSLSLPAQAADRMRAGQWVGTTIVGGKTLSTSSCVSQRDADAMNGDAQAIKAYLETIIPPEICKITDVKVDGNRVVYTASCRGAASKTVTTSYHGDRSDGSDSAGGITQAKLIGACK
jgi:Protein of unknown function (DUF3617)